MFALRNIGDETSIKALASSLNDSSALFRHEVAFVLGQVASPHARGHECAEALASHVSPTISRTKEIKYKMVRSSKHAKRSNMKKTK